MTLTGQMLVTDTKAAAPAVSTSRHAQMLPIQTPSSDPCTGEILHRGCYIHTHNILISTGKAVNFSWASLDLRNSRISAT